MRKMILMLFVLGLFTVAIAGCEAEAEIDPNNRALPGHVTW